MPELVVQLLQQTNNQTNININLKQSNYQYCHLSSTHSKYLHLEAIKLLVDTSSIITRTNYYKTRPYCMNFRKPRIHFTHTAFFSSLPRSSKPVTFAPFSRKSRDLKKMAAATGLNLSRAVFCNTNTRSSAHLTICPSNLASNIPVASSGFSKHTKLQSSSSFLPLTLKPSKSIKTKSAKFNTKPTRVYASASENGAPSGLSIDLRGKRAFIAGIADDNGYGWAIAKSLAAAGAEILVGTWVPAMNIFETSLRRGKFDESRILPNGSMMEISKVYAMDAVYDTPEDVPEDVKSNKRYAGASNWTVQELVECVKLDFGTIDILVHSLANGPEVIKPLLETSRNGYLAAVSASSYSFVSLLKYFIPIMNPGGSTISLTYIASERIIPGYGGGMSSAKAALESDTRVLAFEAGRRYNIRVNTISAGPLRSRAAKAIGFIDTIIEYSKANAPLQKELLSDEVGNAAAFLASPLASAITGTVAYVDNGLHAMGVGIDSPAFSELAMPQAEKIKVAA